MELEFGKKVACGNYYILKKSRSLSKAELKKLRRANGIPAEVQKHLQRGSLPYIKVSTISENWSVEFAIGMTMYAFIDATQVVMDDEGNRMVFGEDRNLMENIFVQMMTDTTLVGDKEYRLGKMKLRQEYLDREAKRMNEVADAGKTEYELRKESDEAVQEVIDRDKHAATILEMGEHIAKEEKGGE